MVTLCANVIPVYRYKPRSYYEKAARYTGGIWVGKFLRTVTYQGVRNDRASGELGRLCARAARMETFEGLARSGDLRAKMCLNEWCDWIEEGQALYTQITRL